MMPLPLLLQVVLKGVQVNDRRTTKLTKHRHNSEKSQKQSRAHNPHVSLERFWSASANCKDSRPSWKDTFRGWEEALERCPHLLDQKRLQMPSSSLVMFRNCTLFFSAVPQRWTILKQHVTAAIKSWSDTQWESSSRNKAGIVGGQVQGDKSSDQVWSTSAQWYLMTF